MAILFDDLKKMIMDNINNNGEKDYVVIENLIDNMMNYISSHESHTRDNDFFTIKDLLGQYARDGQILKCISNDSLTDESKKIKLQELINDYSLTEFDEEANFSDLNRIPLAYSTLSEDEDVLVELSLDLENMEWIISSNKTDYLIRSETSLDELITLFRIVDFDILFEFASDEVRKALEEPYHKETTIYVKSNNVKTTVEELQKYIGKSVFMHDGNKYRFGGIITKIDEELVYLNDEMNPKGYQLYTINKDDFIKWHEVGLYKIRNSSHKKVPEDNVYLLPSTFRVGSVLLKDYVDKYMLKNYGFYESEHGMTIDSNKDIICNRIDGKFWVDVFNDDPKYVEIINDMIKDKLVEKVISYEKAYEEAYGVAPKSLEAKINEKQEKVKQQEPKKSDVKNFEK